MQYRKLQADKFFNGFEWIKEGSVLILDEKGFIEEIISAGNAGDDIEKLDGILMPGLINCHCHLELSHLKNLVPQHTGLVDFLLTVIKKRNFDKEEILAAIVAAEKELYENGTVAVADICNTNDAIPVKNESHLFWQNFIEVFNLQEGNLQKQLTHYTSVLDQYNIFGKTHSASRLTPHAPYSLSEAGFKFLNEASANSIISIHNQESPAEDELFKTGQGEFLKLFTGLGEQHTPFEVSNKSSLQTWLPHFTKGQTILLVHNTYISEEDIVFAKAHAEKYNLNLVYCLCPNANFYIENTLPPVELLIKHDCKIVLGTDSYSSNWQLNIASEIKMITHHFPQIDMEFILQWATSNGANALDYASRFGILEKGKNPGIVLLETNAQKVITGRSLRIA